MGTVIGAMEIYILAGQSNMAGRGDLRDLPAQYRSASDEVMCFNAEGNWIQATEPLHRDIDLRKRDRCGVGPALVCARAVLKLRKDSSSSSPQSQVIGVVPCAIGGASLDEWQKSFHGVVGDCEAYKERAKHGHESHPWGYKPGSKNLFGAMAARIKEALKAAPEGSRLGGVLWYQGETDAMKEDSARTYLGRFQTLVADVRELGYPHLQFFTVAITGTTSRLPYLDKVRDAQLHAGSAEEISGIWVVDAFGLPMFTDGLHLLTNAQVEVGERMALQVFAATESNSRITKGARTKIDGWTGGWVREDARVSKAEKEFDRISTLAKYKCDGTHHTVSQGTKDVERQTTSITNRTGDSSSAPTHEEPRTAGVPADRERHGKRDLADAKSSEVRFRSFANLLSFLGPAPAPHDCLLVLGQCVGTCLIGGALLYNMRSIQGLHLMQGYPGEARALLLVYSDDSSTVVTVSDGLETSPRELRPQEDACSARTPSSSIALLEGDISEAPWSSATLVYVDCNHFDDGIMLDIATRCRYLSGCARVITLGKPLPMVQSRRVEEGTVTGEEFRVAWQSQVGRCCGRSAVAFVHHRVSSPA